ncbi:MAG: EamA family transporter [Balneolales bacterium]
MSRNVVVESSLLFIVCVWALNFSVVKFSLDEIDPLSFNAIRFLLAIAFIWLVVWRRRIPIKVQKGDWPRIVTLGLLGNLVYQVLFIYGINFTYSANAAVMLGTIPVWVALVSHMFFEEKLTRIKFIGVCFAFAGVIFIMVGGEQGFSLSAESVIGDLIIVVAAMVFAVYTLLSKSMLDRYTPLELSTLILTVGGLAIVIIAIPNLVKLDHKAISWLAWGGAFYSGVFSIGMAYLVWNYGIKQVGAVRTSTYQNLVPVLGIILGFLLLGEKLMIMQYAGTAFVISGIVLARR